jgi:hypothetical protein
MTLLKGLYVLMGRGGEIGRQGDANTALSIACTLASMVHSMACTLASMVHSMACTLASVVHSMACTLALDYAHKSVCAHEHRRLTSTMLLLQLTNKSRRVRLACTRQRIAVFAGQPGRSIRPHFGPCCPPRKQGCTLPRH